MAWDQVACSLSIKLHAGAYVESTSITHVAVAWWCHQPCLNITQCRVPVIFIVITSSSSSGSSGGGG